jgi:hypothetical protein
MAAGLSLAVLHTLGTQGGAHSSQVAPQGTGTPAPTAAPTPAPSPCCLPLVLRPLAPTPLPSPTTPAAPGPKPTIVGVTALQFGTGFSGDGACRLVGTMPWPVQFPQGTTQFAYQVEVDPDLVTSADVSLSGPPPPPAARLIPCNVDIVRHGAPFRVQFGGTATSISAYASGIYELAVTIDGATTVVPFTIQ